MSDLFIPHVGEGSPYMLSEPGFAKFRVARIWLFAYNLAHERASRYRDAQDAEAIFRLYMQFACEVIARAVYAALEREAQS